MMENPLFQDGLMEKSESSFLSQENFSMSSMMLIITAVPQSPSLPMEKESFQEELRVKLGSGRSLNKPKLWKFPSRNIAVEFGPSKSVRITVRPCQPAVMAHASYGTLKNTQDCCVCLKPLLLSRLF